MFTYTSDKIKQISPSWKKGNRRLAIPQTKFHILGYLQLTGVPPDTIQTALNQVEGVGVDPKINLFRFLKATRDIVQQMERGWMVGRL